MLPLRSFRRGSISICHESLTEFLPAGRKKADPFFPATCALEKTLLRLQTCPLAAKRTKDALQQPAARQKSGLLFFDSLSTPALFRTGRGCFPFLRQSTLLFLPRIEIFRQLLTSCPVGIMLGNRYLYEIDSASHPPGGREGAGYLFPQQIIFGV